MREPARLALFLCKSLLDSPPGRAHTDAALDDRIVVKIPTRPWAVSAVDDLIAEGVKAKLLDCQDAAGLYQVEVSGCPESIALIRYELHIAENRVCWETFVNEAITG